MSSFSEVPPKHYKIKNSSVRCRPYAPYAAEYAAEAAVAPEDRPSPPSPTQHPIPLCQACNDFKQPGELSTIGGNVASQQCPLTRASLKQQEQNSQAAKVSKERSPERSPEDQSSLAGEFLLGLLRGSGEQPKPQQAAGEQERYAETFRSFSEAVRLMGFSEAEAQQRQDSGGGAEDTTLPPGIDGMLIDGMLEPLLEGWSDSGHGEEPERNAAIPDADAAGSAAQIPLTRDRLRHHDAIWGVDPAAFAKEHERESDDCSSEGDGRDSDIVSAGACARLIDLGLVEEVHRELEKQVQRRRYAEKVASSTAEKVAEAEAAEQRAEAKLAEAVTEARQNLHRATRREREVLVKEKEWEEEMKRKEEETKRKEERMEEIVRRGQQQLWTLREQQRRLEEIVRRGQQQLWTLREQQRRLELENAALKKSALCWMTSFMPPCMPPYRHIS